MGRDTFGGPSACHITHQSVGSGYLGPVTGTVAEQAAWLIRFFLQIADQWLWVGRWIFPFPLSPLFFCFPLLASSSKVWCMWCFHELYWMTDTSRRGGRLTCWLGDRHPHGGLTWTIHTHTLIHSTVNFLYPFLSHTFYRMQWNYGIILLLLWGGGVTLSALWKIPVNYIRKSFITAVSLGRSCCWMYYWHMWVPKWPPWWNHSQSKFLKDILTG